MDSSVFISRYYMLDLFFLILCFKTLNANWTLPFAFKNFGEDSRFESQLSLFGDAQLVNDSMFHLQLSGSVISSAGRVMYREPIKLLEENPRNLVSFATEFVFSLTGEKGDGLAFVLVPHGYPKAAVFTNGGSFGLPLRSRRKFMFLAVEFDTLMNKEFNDINDNHIGIDVGKFVSSKISNISLANLVLTSGEKLQAWIDYEASSQRLEIRLTKFGGIRPVNPLLSYPINLSSIWGSNQVFVGLSSSSGNTLQKCNVYSWSLQLRTAPHWMHSEPLDPNTFVNKDDDDDQKKIKHGQKSECAMRIVTALVFGTGCGALGAIVVLFLWVVLGSKALVVPGDYPVQTKEVEYKKPKGIDNAIQEATKS